jgi:nitrite reductase/ring-hydroxylating ferredoxin subunit
MGWTKVLATEELAADGRQVVKIAGRSLLLLNHGGQIYAVNNICPHLKLPLKKGKITEDGAIVCPWHRSSFDLETGNVKTWCPWPPAVGTILGKVSSESPLPVFPTRIEEGQIWVELSA